MNKTGKFYWVLDDFKYIGSFYPKNEETLHAVAVIDSFVADDNMIRLTTKPIDFGEGEIAYSVNLLRETDKKYSGQFHILNDPDSKGSLDAELFENQHKHFLNGIWKETYEDGSTDIFTWFAYVDK